MIEQLLMTGANVELLTLEDNCKYNTKSVIKTIAIDRKSVKKDIKDDANNLILCANNIDEIIYEQIRSKLLSNSSEKAITEEEQNQYDKFKLAKHYNKKPEELTIEFIEKYNSIKTKNIYRENINIYKFNTLDEYLEAEKKTLSDDYSYALDINDAQPKYLLNPKNNRYAKSSRIINLIKGCGFDDINDDIKIELGVMEANAYNIYKKYIKNQNELQHYDTLFQLKKFNIIGADIDYRKPDKKAFISNIIKWVNVPLQTFGIKVAKKREHYILHNYGLNDLFQISKTIDASDNRPFIQNNRS
jgi:hypothetical protein